MNLSWSSFARAALLSSLLVLSSLRLSAQFTISDFSTAIGLTYNGNAAVNGTTATITPALSSQQGSVYYNTPQSVAGDFTASLTFTLTNTNYGINGADGLALVFQNDPRGATALGGGGGNLGVGGSGNAVTKMVGVGVQTFDANEVRLFVNPANPSYSTSNFSANGSYFGDLTLTSHVLSVNYTAATTSLTVSLDGTQQFSYSLGSSLTSLLGGSTAYIGISGATGSVSALQSATNFTFSTVPEPSTVSLIATGAALIAWRALRRRPVRC
jgi:hypothetical protein